LQNACYRRAFCCIFEHFPTEICRATAPFCEKGACRIIRWLCERKEKQMAFSEIELKKIEKFIGGICQKRSPEHLKDKI
jgi:hypothetical protein